jgi:hypothetical protein
VHTAAVWSDTPSATLMPQALMTQLMAAARIWSLLAGMQEQRLSPAGQKARAASAMHAVGC